MTAQYISRWRGRSPRSRRAAAVLRAAASSRTHRIQSAGNRRFAVSDVTTSRSFAERVPPSDEIPARNTHRRCPMFRTLLGLEIGAARLRCVRRSPSSPLAVPFRYHHRRCFSGMAFNGVVSAVLSLPKRQYSVLRRHPSAGSDPPLLLQGQNRIRWRGRLSGSAPPLLVQSRQKPPSATVRAARIDRSNVSRNNRVAEQRRLDMPSRSTADTAPRRGGRGHQVMRAMPERARRSLMSLHARR